MKRENVENLVESKPEGESPSGFLSPESRVVTPSGFACATDIQPGEVVATGHHGFRPVRSVWRSDSPMGVVHLVTRGICKPLTLRPGQPVWAIKGESKKCAAMGLKWDALIGSGDKPQYIPADFVSPGDFLHIPAQQGNAMPISEALAWAYGLYLAEGSALVEGGASKLHFRVAMTMHERELPVLERFAGILSDELGMTSPRVHLRKRVNYTSEYVHSGREFALHFRELFGHGAMNKTLPVWMHDMAPNLKRAVVQGWIDGDGHTAQKNGYVQTSATTISERMAMQLYQLAVSAGLRPSMATLAAGGRRKNNSYTLHFNSGQESVEVAGQVFYRVNARYRSAEPASMVGLSVEGASSVVVENVEVLL